MFVLAYIEITATANTLGMSGEGAFTVYGEGSFNLRFSDVYEGMDTAWDMHVSDCFKYDSITVEHVVYYYDNEDQSRDVPFYAAPSTRERLDGWREMAYAC
jgi:hypothetical protein